MQQIDAADNLIQRFETELSEKFTDIFSNIFQVADELLNGALIMGSQIFVLSGDTDGAAIEVADAEDFAAEDDQQRGAEAETLGAHHGGFDHVATDFQAAVGLQCDQFTQIVGFETLVRFSQSQFPWVAGRLDRTERGGAGAAIASGNDNLVCVSLGDPRGNSADSCG